MARTLTRDTSLYETDYLAWIEEQAGHLRAGRWRALDARNLAEELDDMGRSEREELYNRLEVLLTYLLKWDHQPRRRSRSWEATIAEQRRRLKRRLRRSPSLKGGLEETVSEAYEGALEQAGIETGLGPKAFPAANPYTPVQIFGFDPFERRNGSAMAPADILNSPHRCPTRACATATARTPSAAGCR